MSASGIAATESRVALVSGPDHLKAFFTAVSVLVPVGIWFAPFGIEPAAQHAMAISAFMILAWMTNIMEYGAAGLIGCLLFWTIGGAKLETAFSGFVSDTPWFLFGAILLGAAATKTGLPQRVGAF